MRWIVVLTMVLMTGCVGENVQRAPRDDASNEPWTVLSETRISPTVKLGRIRADATGECFLLAVTTDSRGGVALLPAECLDD